MLEIKGVKNQPAGGSGLRIVFDRREDEEKKDG